MTLNFNIGVEAVYVSAFKGYNYNPELNSFSAQSIYNTYGTAIVSPFVNGQIQNFSFWIKYSYLNQILVKTAYPNEKVENYFATPGYVGLPHSLIFGINWMLFE
jgi:hypothetical protein